MISSGVDWYAARASGVVAYLLLTVVVVLGMLQASKLRFRRWPAFALEDVHRFGAILVGAFVGIHGVTLLLDATTRFSLADVLVPLTSPYRPFWTALGIVAAELLLALAVANRLRRRLPYRLWRRAHFLNFAVWAAATLHSFGGGTDRGTGWLLTFELVSVGVVLSTLALRLPRTPTAVRGPRGSART